MLKLILSLMEVFLIVYFYYTISKLGKDLKNLKKFVNDLNREISKKI